MNTDKSTQTVFIFFYSRLNAHRFKKKMFQPVKLKGKLEFKVQAQFEMDNI